MTGSSTDRGRVALVTGASEGIGLASARHLAAAGHAVILAARNRPALEKAAATIEADIAGARVTVLELDVGSVASMDAALAEIAGSALRIDILVNNAGLVIGPAAFSEATAEAVQKSLEVNLFGAMHLTQRLLPAMRERQYGRIVNIASTAGMHGPPGLIPYSVSKAALIAFTRTLAVEVARAGVSVTSVSPGPVATANYRASKGAEGVANRARPIPSGRLAEPDDVGALVAFLASEGAGHLTGQNIALDGGEDAAGPYVSMVLQQRAARESGK
ncbi:SDR family NAD(P)-dependent oxidoreductase [Devosia sp.]|jgi:NAD(P)-dependent dehydrogenase (short-subunit alcohol dehydrogenase family)|uniref:SDR family NAD(P)-dependent oxidoreductase n=1 Tax=Devosia sp. TaxID=1871048 RepID=UPI0037C0E8CC